jgi:hypothetical protein
LRTIPKRKVRIDAVAPVKHVLVAVRVLKDRRRDFHLVASKLFAVAACTISDVDAVQDVGGDVFCLLKFRPRMLHVRVGRFFVLKIFDGRKTPLQTPVSENS